MSLVHFSCKYKSIQLHLYYKAMLYWLDMKSFVEQILIKFRGFDKIHMNLIQIVLVTSTPKHR